MAADQATGDMIVVLVVGTVRVMEDNQFEEDILKADSLETEGSPFVAGNQLMADKNLTLVEAGNLFRILSLVDTVNFADS